MYHLFYADRRTILVMVSMTRQSTIKHVLIVITVDNMGIFYFYCFVLKIAGCGCFKTN